MKQRTFFMIKPDCIRNSEALLDVIHMLADADLEVIAHKFHKFTRAELEVHYADVSHLPFFEDLVEYMTRDYVIMMVVEGEDAIQKARDILGVTDPDKAAHGTLRNIYGKRERTASGNIENCAHASDSPESAEREIALYFPELDR